MNCPQNYRASRCSCWMNWEIRSYAIIPSPPSKVAKPLGYDRLVYVEANVYNSNIAITWTHVFDWNVATCGGSKNKYQKNVFIIELDYLLRIWWLLWAHCQHDLGAGAIWPPNGHKDVHFDIERDIHVSSENCEANGDMTHDVDLLIIMHSLRTSYPTRRDNITQPNTLNSGAEFDASSGKVWMPSPVGSGGLGQKLLPIFLIGWGLTWSHKGPPRVIWGRRTQI